MLDRPAATARPASPCPPEPPSAGVQASTRPRVQQPGRRQLPGIGLSGILFVVALTLPGRAQDAASLATPPDATSPTHPPTAPASPPPSPAAEDRSAGFNRLITQIVLDNLPHHVIDDDDWGGTRRIWDGVRMWWEGSRLETKRRWKTVNHGTWKRYEIRLIDPQQEFQISVHNLRELRDGRVGFDAQVDAALDVSARIAEWQYGVQLFSIIAQATAVVRLRVSCSLAMQLDPTRLPPDVILDPKVLDADLQLVHFRLHRISDADGPVVRELGRSVRKIIEDELEDRRGRTVAKINRQIDRNRGELRLSLRELLASQWGSLAARQLAAD